MPSASASATASTTAWSPGMYLRRPTCVKKKWCQSAGRVSILWRGLTDVPGDRRGALGIILGTVRADGARWRKMRKVGQLPQMQGSLKDYPLGAICDMLTSHHTPSHYSGMGWEKG